jgi:hypothetical protein
MTRNQASSSGRLGADSHSIIQLVLFGTILTGLNLPSPRPEAEAGERRQVVATPGRAPDEETFRKVVLPPPPLPAYPANMVRWGPEGRPHPSDSGQFEIWDITQSQSRKMIMVYSDADGIPDATVFLEPGGRVRLPLRSGHYAIRALAGSEWNGRDFGPATAIVGFRDRSVQKDGLTVLVIGATDDPAIPVEDEGQ